MNEKHFTPINVDLTWADFREKLMNVVCADGRERLEKGIHPVKLWAYASEAEKVAALHELPESVQQQLWLALIGHHGDAQLVEEVEKLLDTMLRETAPNVVAKTALRTLQVAEYAMYLDWTQDELRALRLERIPVSYSPYAVPDWGRVIVNGRWLVDDSLPIVFADIQDSYYGKVVLVANDGSRETVPAVQTSIGLFRLEGIPTLARQYALYDIVEANNWHNDDEWVAEDIYCTSGNATVGVDFGALTAEEVERLTARLSLAHLQHVGSDEREPYVRVFNIEGDDRRGRLMDIVESIASAAIF